MKRHQFFTVDHFVRFLPALRRHDVHLKNSLCQINSDNLFHGTPLHVAVGLHLQHGSLRPLWGGVHFISA